MNLIAKLVEVGTEVEGQIDGKFIDETDVETNLKVHVCFKDILEVGRVYVMHRAMSTGSVVVLNANGMLTQAPSTGPKPTSDSLKFRLAMCQHLCDQNDVR